MSTTEADRIRAEIDDTRHEVSRDIDALADKVSPSKIVERKTRKVRAAVSGAVSGARDFVVGAVDTAQEGVAVGAEAVGDGADRAVVAAKGHPIAVGMIALGIGWIASALIPASKLERRAADSVKDAAGPVMHEAGDALADAADNLREPAREAAAAVGDAASEAVENVRSDAEGAAADVRGDSGTGEHATVPNPPTASGPASNQRSTAPIVR